MNTYLFLLYNFIIGFVSDLILNYLSTNDIFVKSLKPYFKNKNFIIAGVYAGLTIVIALIVQIYLSKIIFKYKIPNKFSEIVKYLILAYIIGYIFDYIIYKFKIFDGLEQYYKELGVGHWGAIAFIFSILISLIIQKFIIKNYNN